MNKGLEMLERHKKSIEDLFDNGTILSELHYVFMNELDIVEKEFKESENYKLMYRLEHEKNQQLTQANLKMSKALEIIKNKQIDVLYVAMHHNNLEEYNKHVAFVHNEWCLTQEEYDLLKEVLL